MIDCQENMENQKFLFLNIFDIAMSAITSFTRFPLLLIFFLGVIFFSISIVLSLIYLLLFYLASFKSLGSQQLY